MQNYFGLHSCGSAPTQVMGLVGGRGRSNGHHLPSVVQALVAIVLALAEDSCGNVDNTVRDGGSANLCYKHKCWMLEHPTML